MTHHEKDGTGDHADHADHDHGNDGSTAHPDAEVTAEDEQDTASGGAPERP